MKFDFPNKEGLILSGLLELPAENQKKPRAFALFAHCFTCSKDYIAAGVISRSLTNSGIGVLRFDFTGLGNSEGDFSNTNFSSNVEDLVSACVQLTKEFKAPELLIGHSLGGTAILKAAARLESVKAVVTISAPSSAEHVLNLFDQSVVQIEQNGLAEVNLAGRKFTIKKQFIDDIKEVEILESVKNFNKALLILHSPVDNIVSINHAAKIFIAAKHPKSFISLDHADHLLKNPIDAHYAADVISAWVLRYLSEEVVEADSLKEGNVLVKSRINAKFTQDIYTNGHHLVGDEPKSSRGNDLGLNPYQFILAGLGICTSMTMKMYADLKGIPLESVEVELTHDKVHAKDCESCETETSKIDKIVKTIKLAGPLSEEQKSKLLEIADKCPVNRTLKSEIKIETRLFS